MSQNANVTLIMIINTILKFRLIAAMLDNMKYCSFK